MTLGKHDFGDDFDQLKKREPEPPFKVCQVVMVKRSGKKPTCGFNDALRAAAVPALGREKHWDNVGYELLRSLYAYREAHDGVTPGFAEMGQMVKHAYEVSGWRDSGATPKPEIVHDKGCLYSQAYGCGCTCGATPKEPK